MDRGCKGAGAAHDTNMKKFLLSLALLVATSAMGVFAQNSLVATLNHNDTIKVYYGSNALKNAHSAAVDGDIITLSSGTFLATNITKGITLRGAGAWPDTVAKRQPTVITGDFRIGVSNGVVSNQTIEGIYHNHTITYYGTSKNTNLIKNRLKTITQGSDQWGHGVLTNATVVHCYISTDSYFASSTINFQNCVVNKPTNSSDGSMEYNNCLIGSINGKNSYNSTYTNCIIYQEPRNGNQTSSAFGSSNMAYNCVNPSKVKDHPLFANIPNSTNIYSTVAEVFKTYRSGALENNDSEVFELTDSAKTTFLGVDGTQVGIYGGSFPFDRTVTVPQITKFEVAKQSTSDGKLNVNIEVNAAAEEPKK